MTTSTKEQNEIANAINVHKSQNPDTVSLPVKYDEALRELQAKTSSIKKVKAVV